jgi:ATP-dependent DNA helicase RecG
MILVMEEMSNGFFVNLQYADQKTTTLPINERVKKRVSELSKTEQFVVDAISKNPIITQKQLAAELHLSEQHIRKLMKKLKDTGLIRRSGSDKTGLCEMV